MKRKLFVTTSLPYANGQLHLGHILENIQADIWVRYQKSTGNECVFISGDDAHGSAIMLSAQKNNVSAEEWVDKIREDHYADLKGFNIDYDVFHTTRSSENKKIVYEIYENLKKENHFAIKNIKQLYDEKKEMFLPDRFIKGTCPKCKAKDQYGDHCEKCGSTYDPTDLIDVYSTLSNSKPVLRESEHVFFKLSEMQDVLDGWLHKSDLQDPVRNKLLEWFKSGLKDWDISRDSPYFGFVIPGYENKYFYVWMDAPVGYLAGLLSYDLKNNKNLLDEIWKNKNTSWERHHFIGKDIVYFHGLFWPATLLCSGFNAPTSIHAHGFLTIEGEKMSKSRGTFINAKDFLAKLSPEYLRYYFACKLSDGVSDMDLSWDDFINRCNSDLVGKIINIGSRSCGFIHKYFEGSLASSLDSEELFNEFIDFKLKIQQGYEDKLFSQVIRDITKLADKANKYVDKMKPWVMVKDSEKFEKVHMVITTSLHLFRLIMLYLQPVLPETAKKVAKIFNQESLDWDKFDQKLLGQEVTSFPRLIERIKKEDCPCE